MIPSIDCACPLRVKFSTEIPVQMPEVLQTLVAEDPNWIIEPKVVPLNTSITVPERPSPTPMRWVS